jgi:oxygen-independent coproporphyrinogen-3 oxidase
LGHGTQEERALTLSERIEEAVLMGLRTAEGIDARRFAARTGTSLQHAVPESKSRRLEDSNLLVRDRRGLRARRAGRFVLNAVIAQLLA